MDGEDVGNAVVLSGCGLAALTALALGIGVAAWAVNWAFDQVWFLFN